MMLNRPRERSIADMANEQLNGTGHRDRLAEGLDAASRKDCIRSNPNGSLLNLFTVPYDYAKGKCR